MNHSSGPNEPNKPTVDPSDPVIKERIVQNIRDKIDSDGFDGYKISLRYIREYLRDIGLDIDKNGFIIRKNSGEYAVPYTFVEDLVREYEKDEDESVFEAFFRPTTDERVYGWDRSRVHLTDLHSTVKIDDKYHPVRYSFFKMGSFHARLLSRFKTIMEWSNIIKDENIDDDGTWITIAKDSDKQLKLNCMNLNCQFRGDLSDFDGNLDHSPICPDCGGEWDADNITVCTICCSWYWGTYFNGDSIHAEPACANCGANMEHLENINRYSEVDSYADVINKNRPEYAVIGVNENNDKIETFEYTSNRDVAKNKKENIKKRAIRLYDNVTSVKIIELEEFNSVTKYERSDS